MRALDGRTRARGGVRGSYDPRDGDRAKIINLKRRKAALLYLQLIGEEYDWLASPHIEVVGIVIGCELHRSPPLETWYLFFCLIYYRNGFSKKFASETQRCDGLIAIPEIVKMPSCPVEQPTECKYI